MTTDARTSRHQPRRRAALTNPESPFVLERHDEAKRWGPYLADRHWGTVREDYSANGTAWEFISHDEARSHAYRWGEDGLLGFCDDQAQLCFAVALWNERDPIIKERLFGLTGNEGNHGEDVKEAYYFLDGTPDHTYMKALYKYPQAEFPYGELVAENGRRGKQDPEYELIDTGIFAEDRYFDVEVEYAKADPDDILIRITATNRGPDPAPLHLLPTLWFRNTWSWGWDDRKPSIAMAEEQPDGDTLLRTEHHLLGEYWLAAPGQPDVLFTENESNAERLWGVPNATPYVKDGVNDYVVGGRSEAVSPARTGTKVALRYASTVASGASEQIVLRLSHRRHQAPLAETERVFLERLVEADAFYDVVASGLDEDERRVQRQAYAGLLWSKQVYLFNVARWLEGDPAQPEPPAGRKWGRNAHWRHLNSAHVFSMPDTWEYPWFAAWDLAFHCVAFARIDPGFAKEQLSLLLRDYFQHPDGQIPAYEWAFGDVNPPVHAWAAWQVYRIELMTTGAGDREFLERVFHRLLLNFTWWVNRKDADGSNVFQGGFLGLDNIGVFDRSAALPTGGTLEQSDATAWMGMFSLNMCTIAIELAQENPVYEDTATKFFNHFLMIAAAMSDMGGSGIDIWDEEDGFFYDVLLLPDGTATPLRIRSLVGLLPMLAVATLEPDVRKTVPRFDRQLRYFLSNRPDIARLVPTDEHEGMGKRRLFSLVHGDRLRRLLERMLDEDRFLSDHGIRSISKIHEREPYEFDVNGAAYTVHYEPAESRSGLFGGNSNWRGPVWFPINYLLIGALRRYHTFYGDEFTVECPVGSGKMLNLEEVADELARRLETIFLRDDSGKRAVYGDNATLQEDPYWRDHVLFYEYFHGDTGAGLGASHQTGWTGLVASLLCERGRRRVERAARDAPVSEAPLDTANVAAEEMAGAHADD